MTKIHMYLNMLYIYYTASTGDDDYCIDCLLFHLKLINLAQKHVVDNISVSLFLLVCDQGTHWFSFSLVEYCVLSL